MPRWSAGGFEHTLFSAGNPGSAAHQGFALYANGANESVIRLAPFGVLTLDQAPPVVSLTAKAHIALTVEAQGSGRLVRLFIDGNPAGKTLLVTYDAPAGWDLLIGAANRMANPGSLEISRPFIGQIQEVVLHRKALSAKELQNHGAINRPLKSADEGIMSNPLTGDFDAILQVSGSTVNRLLASMHQNAFTNRNLPSFPHTVQIRIGDDR